MGTGRGKREEKNLQNQAQAQMDAWQPTAIENKDTADILQFKNDWSSGKDIKDIDYLKPYYNLFNSAKNRETDERGIGAMGFNDLTGGSGQLAGLIGRQLQARNEQNASGQLYNAANQAHDAATNQGNFLTGVADNRAAGKAGLANQRYTAYLNRPHRPSFWEKLLAGGQQAAASFASSSGGGG